MSRARRGRRLAGACIVISAMLGASPEARPQASTGTGPEVRAALVYNFAKFVQWPALPAGASILVCIVDDDEMATAFVEIVRGQNISGHVLDLARPQEVARWRACQLLFIGATDPRRLPEGLSGLQALPVLTVGGGKGFLRAGGMIELYVEDGRMRFTINLDVVDRAGLHINSRLLGLAKVVRDGNVP